LKNLNRNVLKRLVANYNKLLDNFQQDKHINVNHLRYSLSTIDVQEERPEPVAVQRKLSKSVRFKEDLEEHEPNSGEPERERERFMQPYKDDPEPLDERSNLTSNGLFVEQQQMMRDQDQHLDRLALSVSRQHELSIQIDDELSSHIELLGDVEALTDRSQSRLEMAKKRLEKFSKQAKENGSMLTIGILILIFIILIVVLK
jgi:syntaxin 8